MAVGTHVLGDGAAVREFGRTYVLLVSREKLVKWFTFFNPASQKTKKLIPQPLQVRGRGK